MQQGVIEQERVMSEVDHARLSELVQGSAGQVGDAGDRSDVATLAQKLREATVLAPAAVPRTVVTMRSLVQLRDLERNEKFSCTLSFPDEADPTRQHVSVLSPLGATMVATRVGEVVECPTPSGPRQLRVERIYYQPEGARDYHL